ncbi:MAG TPA: ATP-binding protein [Candidatus Thermoplasmatota archaeon]|nr:ATP-binding protein [Candidatus Thermoplasmatota archaeon]
MAAVEQEHAALENARLIAELRDREERLRRYNDALVRLARLTIHERGDLVHAARAIVEESARALDVERVSVWVYDAERTSIRCLDLFERAPHRHSAGIEITQRDNPAYFRALAEERTIAAEDARTDPRTRDFAAAYLEPLGICSMLDAPLRVGGRVVGVLCHEHVGRPRRWLPEEEIFAGALAGLMSLVLETERRGREQGMLQESEERFTRLADEAPIGIWLTDPDLKNTFNNRWRCELLGIPNAELLGDRWRAFVHPEDDAHEFARVWPDILARRPFRTQHRLRARDGTWRHMLNVANPRFASDGRFLGYIGAEFDITDRVEAQRALEEARRDLARGERLAAMGSLVSGVAHEIRTPLAYIANNATLLRRHVPPDAHPQLEAILEGVDRVNALVSDLRRFTREASGPRAPARLDELAAAAARFYEATHRGGVRLVTELGETPPVPLDVNRVQQVILNLLENAAEASARGGLVRLQTRALPDGSAELRVRDEGAGIPPEVQALMFEPFFTTKAEGTGLGLSIVRRIVEAHRGRIVCESEAGRGSTFIVSFPAAP